MMGNPQFFPLIETFLRASFFLALLFVCAACNQKNEEAPMDIRKLDWKAMAFTCTTEQNPPLDPEADVWFQQARAYEKLDQEANDKEMLHLYRQAAERGHYKAIFNLSRLYAYGFGVPQDEGKALDLVEQALKLNIPYAYYLMGAMLQQGIGVKQDKTAALAYFRRAADLGNRYGQWVVGREFSNAFARHPEPERSRAFAIAAQMLECALGQDLAEAGHELGLHYAHMEKNAHKGLEYFQKAAALGYRGSLFRLYAVFKDGNYGLDKDPERAACYEGLLQELDDNPDKRFPDIGQRCPLPALAPVAATPAEPPANLQARSGQPCPWSGVWASVERYNGEHHFQHGDLLPQVDGRSVTWTRLRPT